MVELTKLGDAHAHATSGSTAAATPLPTARNFAAVIQHITSAKRMRLDRQGAQYSGAPSRVATYHVIHIADPTKAFFKLLCWGDTLPTFKREDHEGENISLGVGDMVLFSTCVIKAFRGNVEAQYTRHSSVQLLYRRDRYFNTRDVQLKDLYPMIDWYKKHRHEVLVGVHASGSSESQDGSTITFSAIRELREDMLANVRCSRIRRRVEANVQLQQQQHASALPNSSDHDGVQLCEVTMEDGQHDTMVLNLWDQYADPRFVARIESHRGTVDILGVVVSHNALANRLLANTTPRTAFRFSDTSTSSPGSGGGAFSEEQDRQQQQITTVTELEGASLHDDHVVLENVVIEHVLLQSFMGKSDRVQPQFTPLLVECYCAVCEQTLPLLQVNTVPQLYAPCKNRCRVSNNGASDRKWRYRTVQMVLRDGGGPGRITVDVGSTVLTRLLGNIKAELLIHPQPAGEAVLPFNPHTAVAMLMNAIVEGSNSTGLIGGAKQIKYRVELERVDRTNTRRTSLLLNDSLQSEGGDHESPKPRFVTVALTPIVEYLW